MKMITDKWLKENRACGDGATWLKGQRLRRADLVIMKLMDINRFDWANWAIVRLMTHKQKIQYAVYSAELVIGECEKKYPKNERPRKAIEAAKACIKNPSDKNKNAAANAANAAYSAANAAAYANSAKIKAEIINYGLKLIGAK